MKTKLRNVQALRAIAALLVVIGHASRPGTLPEIANAALSSFAYSGVDIFFVISGFIVSQVAIRSGIESEEIGRLAAAVNFMVHRIFRIYPLYWFALGLALMLGHWVSLAPAGWPYPDTISLITLTTITITPLPPAWSLAFEIYFYASMALVILIFGRWAATGIVVWALAQIAWYVSPHFGVSNWGIASNGLIFEFLFGWIVGLVMNAGVRVPASLSLLCAAIFAITGACMTASHGLLPDVLRVPTFGVAGAFLLFAVLCAEEQGVRAPDILTMLGDFSYSIYLLHLIIVTAVYAALPPTFLTLVLVLALAIGISYASYRLLEVPSQKVGRMTASLVTDYIRPKDQPSWRLL